MSLDSQLKRLEQQIGVVDVCPLCAARAAQMHDERDDGLRVVKSLTVQVDCPRCGSPFDIQVNCVRRAEAADVVGNASKR